MGGAAKSGDVVYRYLGVTECVCFSFEVPGSLHLRQAAAIARTTNGPGSEQSTQATALCEFTMRIDHNNSRITLTAPHHALKPVIWGPPSRLGQSRRRPRELRRRTGHSRLFRRQCTCTVFCDRWCRSCQAHHGGTLSRSDSLRPARNGSPATGPPTNAYAGNCPKDKAGDLDQLFAGHVLRLAVWWPPWPWVCLSAPSHAAPCHRAPRAPSAVHVHPGVQVPRLRGHSSHGRRNPSQR